MVNVRMLGATLAAIGLGIAALVALSMEQHVLSGTLFVLTAFAIYLREKSKESPHADT